MHMIRRVIIPLDGSELAERVIPHLLRFITPQQTELLLMTALSSPQFPLLDDTMRSLESTPATMLHKGETSTRVQVVAQQLSQQGFRVESKFVSGMPAESILHAAEQTCVDLIAMSTHGRTGIGLALLGSVADEVVRNALPPVFLVPAQAIVKPDVPLPQTLLLPLDGTSLAEMAIPAARHFAQNTGAVIHLLRVVEPLDSGSRSSTGCVFVNPEDAREHPVVQQAFYYLERIHARLQLAGIASHWRVAMGDPAVAIAFAADFDNADLIVMSTHGRAGMERMVFGSIASQVIGSAICPVLLMRGKVPVEGYQCSGDAVPANFSG